MKQLLYTLAVLLGLSCTSTINLTDASSYGKGRFSSGVNGEFALLANSTSGGIVPSLGGHIGVGLTNKLDIILEANSYLMVGGGAKVQIVEGHNVDVAIGTRVHSYIPFIFYPKDYSYSIDLYTSVYNTDKLKFLLNPSISSRTKCQLGIFDDNNYRAMHYTVNMGFQQELDSDFLIKAGICAGILDLRNEANAASLSAGIAMEYQFGKTKKSKRKRRSKKSKKSRKRKKGKNSKGNIKM